MAADETSPRPGDTEPELLRKILTILGGKFSPGDTTEKITAKIILALQAGLAGGTPVTKTYVDSGDAAAVASANATSATLYVKKAGDTMTGALAFAQPSLVANNPSLNDAQTWNNAAVAFTGWKFNTTDSASLSSSLLFDFQYNSVDMLTLRKDGRLLLTGGRMAINSVVSPALAFGYSDAGTNTAVANLVMNRNTSGVAAAGLGATFDWQIDSTTTINRLAVRLISTWLDATDATRTGQFAIQTVISGVVSNQMIIGDGGTTIPTSKFLNIQAGANQRAGNLTLVGGTKDVANTTVTANTLVFLTKKTDGGTISSDVTYTLSAGVGFTVTSANGLDTSTFSYFLVENS